jgi:phasin family protein
MSRPPRSPKFTPARAAKARESRAPATHQQQEPKMASEGSKSGGDTPFNAVMQQAKSATEAFTRMFSEMKLPTVLDMEALIAIHRRHMETLSAANRIALEGAQAVAKRHMEIVQQSMAEMGDVMRVLAAPGESPQARAAKQAELLKSAYERAVANTRELSELLQRSNREALELLNKRFIEAMDEVKVLAAKAGPHTS